MNRYIRLSLTSILLIHIQLIGQEAKTQHFLTHIINSIFKQKKIQHRVAADTFEVLFTIDDDTGNNIAINGTVGNSTEFTITDGTTTISNITNNFTKKTNTNITLNTTTAGTTISDFTVNLDIIDYTSTTPTVTGTLKVSISDVMGYFSTDSTDPDIAYVSIINGFGYTIVQSSTTNSYAIIKVDGSTVTIDIYSNVTFYVLIATNYLPTNPRNIQVIGVTNGGKNLASGTPQGQTTATLPYDTTVSCNVQFISTVGIPTAADGAFLVFITDSYVRNAASLTTVFPTYAKTTKYVVYQNRTYKGIGDTTPTPPVLFTTGTFTSTTVTSTVPFQNQTPFPFTSTVGPVTPGNFVINVVI